MENILGKHLGVCTSSDLNLCWPGFPRSTLCFSSAYQGMMTPTNQPDVLLFGLCCIAIFCFYSFPMAIFSPLSQNNRWLTINPCNHLQHFRLPFITTLLGWDIYIYPLHVLTSLSLFISSEFDCCPHSAENGSNRIPPRMPWGQFQWSRDFCSCYLMSQQHLTDWTTATSEIFFFLSFSCFIFCLTDGFFSALLGWLFLCWLIFKSWSVPGLSL